MFICKPFCITVSVLLLLNLSTIHSKCVWKPDCSITCSSNNPLILENITSAMSQLEEVYDKKLSNCADGGIDLKLENLKYSNGTVKQNFFTAKVNVRKLSLKISSWFGFSYLNIEVNAFNSENLRLLEELEIIDISFTPLKKGTFNGLDNLKVLKMEASELRVIEIGLLDELSDTLTEFSLEESTSSGIWEILIEGLTGSGPMKKLEMVKFRYNLATSIERNTLAGLTNVKSLDLSNCQIEVIAAGAFDSLAFIEQLKLEYNKLTVIPDGFFSSILVTNKTQIYLAGNEFLCNCDLMPFKLSLVEHSNFVDKLLCREPVKLHSHPIIQSNICPTSTTVSTSPAPPTPIVCVSADGADVSEVFIDSPAPPAASTEIFESKMGGIVVQVDNLKKSSVLIWFSSSNGETNLNAKDKINCLIASDSESSFRINDLVDHSVYTFCLMDLTELAISPFDCFSYMKKIDSNKLPWIYADNKSRVIGITLVVCGLNVLLGIVIKISTHKIQCWIRSNKEPSVPSYHSSRASSMQRNRTSFMTSDAYMTRRTTNTTVKYFINGNYDAPPLPARPVSMYLMDEPVYATIGDIASIRATSQNIGNNL